MLVNTGHSRYLVDVDSCSLSRFCLLSNSLDILWSSPIYDVEHLNPRFIFCLTYISL